MIAGGAAGSEPEPGLAAATAGGAAGSEPEPGLEAATAGGSDPEGGRGGTGGTIAGFLTGAGMAAAIVGRPGDCATGCAVIAGWGRAGVPG